MAIKSLSHRLCLRHPDDYRIRMVAIGLRGPNILGFGWNNPKTHPMAKEAGRWIPSMYGNSGSDYKSHRTHAEMHCLMNCRTTPEWMVVTRLNEFDEHAMAKPCLVCQKILIESGVKKVFYTNTEGDWECLNL